MFHQAGRARKSSGDTGGSMATTTESTLSRGKRLRGRRGSLKDLPAMPWDILYAIFSELDPVDLIRLARTSKDIRSFLMSKSSALIWRDARKNVEDLPDCPDDLSEPQYANLAFSNHCHVCLRPCIQVDWRLRERACKKCSFSTSTTFWERRVVRDEGFSDETNLVDVLSIPLKGFKDLVIFDRLQTRTMEDHHIQDFLGRWADTSPERKEQFVNLHKSRAAAVNAHAFLCDKWYDEWRDARSWERSHLRQSRKESIILKIKEMGLHDEYVHLSSKWRKKFLSLPEVKQPTALTDRIWNRIKPNIVSFLECRKAERQSQMKELVLKTRFQMLKHLILEEEPLDRISAPLRYVASKPVAQDILDVPHDVQVCREDIERLRSFLANWTEQWRQEVSDHLRNLVRNAIHLTGADGVDPLTLAVGAYWRCPYCKRHILYPGVLAHRCRDRHVLYQSREESQYTQVLSRQCLEGPQQCLDEVQTTAPLVKEIVELYGLDPAWATLSQLDDMQDRVTCHPDMTCQTPGARCIMTWRSAISHRAALNCRPNGAQDLRTTWVKVPQPEVRASGRLEYEALRRAEQVYAESTTWRCALCPTSSPLDSWFKIAQHVEVYHDVKNPDDHVLQWSYQSCIQDTPVYLVSEALQSHPVWSSMLKTGDADIYYPKTNIEDWYINKAHNDDTSLNWIL